VATTTRSIGAGATVVTAGAVVGDEVVGVDGRVVVGDDVVGALDVPASPHPMKSRATVVSSAFL
jgi:hypothetical protein